MKVGVSQKKLHIQLEIQIYKKEKEGFDDCLNDLFDIAHTNSLKMMKIKEG